MIIVYRDIEYMMYIVHAHSCVRIYIYIYVQFIYTQRDFIFFYKLINKLQVQVFNVFGSVVLSSVSAVICTLVEIVEFISSSLDVLQFISALINACPASRSI